eukprot:jgi/Bigna1/144696/aug1.90_g19404
MWKAFQFRRSGGKIYAQAFPGHSSAPCHRYRYLNHPSSLSLLLSTAPPRDLNSRRDDSQRNFTASIKGGKKGERGEENKVNVSGLLRKLAQANKSQSSSPISGEESGRVRSPRKSAQHDTISTLKAIVSSSSNASSSPSPSSSSSRPSSINLMGALGNKKRMGAKSVDMSGIFQKDDSMSSKKSSSSSSRDANSIPAFFKNFKLQKDKGTIPSSAFSPSSSSLPSSSASGQSGKQLLRSVKSKKADLEAKAPAKVAEYDEDDEVGPEFETYASKLKFRKVWQPKKNRPSRAISKEQRACVVPDMMTLRDLSRWTKYSMSKLNDVMVEQLGMRKIDACEYLDASTAELIGLELDIDVQIASKISKIDRLPTVIPEDRS